MSSLIIKPERDKSLRRHHPWVFSGSIEKEMDKPASGQTIDLLSHKGEFLARGSYSPHSQIRVRVWTFDEGESVDEAFFEKRISNAIAIRERLNFIRSEHSLTNKTACRLIHAESDNLPGLIVDQYGDHLVTQFLSTGAEQWKETIVKILVQTTGIENVFNRSDSEIREMEGLALVKESIQGEVNDPLLIGENNLDYKVSIREGHKTGFYLDQRMNRQRVRELAKGCDVLDCFSYTGGFTINALKGGANSVVCLDSSGDSLEIARQNINGNNLDGGKVELIEGNAFEQLRKFRDSRRTFDMIILDPPKFAQTASQVGRASRGYKDINLLAFKLLRPGGLLVTFSCSGAINADLFQKIVAGAALDAGVNARIVQRLGQSGDHPVNLAFPEGNYLKGLICHKE